MLKDAVGTLAGDLATNSLGMVAVSVLGLTPVTAATESTRLLPSFLLLAFVHPTNGFPDAP